jgi:hypothetical protein
MDIAASVRETALNDRCRDDGFSRADCGDAQYL